MRWLAIALMLCGVGINQSFFFASMIEMLWEEGLLSLSSAIDWLHQPRILANDRHDGDQSRFTASPWTG